MSITLFFLKINYVDPVQSDELDELDELNARDMRYALCSLENRKNMASRSNRSVSEKGNRIWAVSFVSKRHLSSSNPMACLVVK